jgi:hypothetical protein
LIGNRWASDAVSCSKQQQGRGESTGRRRQMTKTNLDKMLENAVAKAIGVRAPHKTPRLIVRAQRADHVKHAA